jgi:hypothetical protein
MDVHEGTATIREAMRFSAYLRQPYSTSLEDKNNYVEEMIELLELQDLADAIVMTLGVEGEISVHLTAHSVAEHSFSAETFDNRRRACCET